MALALTLNMVLAAFVVVAIVGGLAWSIMHDRRSPVGEVALARTARPAVTTERRAAAPRGTRRAYATF